MRLFKEECKKERDSTADAGLIKKLDAAVILKQEEIRVNLIESQFFSGN